MTMVSIDRRSLMVLIAAAEAYHELQKHLAEQAERMGHDDPPRLGERTDRGLRAAIMDGQQVLDAGG